MEILFPDAFVVQELGIVLKQYLFTHTLIKIKMPHYHKLGSIPHKRHTQFRKPDGSLYSEQLFSTEGFSTDYALLYHCHPPTQIIKTDPPINVAPQVAEEKMLKHLSLIHISEPTRQAE